MSGAARRRAQGDRVVQYRLQSLGEDTAWRRQLRRPAQGAALLGLPQP